MKRKLFFIIALACCLVIAVGVLAACNESGGSGQQTPGGENPGTEIPGDNPGGEDPGAGEEDVIAGLEFTLNSDRSSYAVSAYTGTSTEITIPSTYEGLPVTSIGEGAFLFCTGLKSVTIPDSVTSIGYAAFGICTGLTSVTIGNGVTSIGGSAFEGCSGLTSIVVEEGNPVYHSDGNCLIETASKTLVVGCKTSVIPDDGSVTSIGYGAFSYCTSLTSITIPDSVTSIGEYAFLFCTGLTSVTFEGTVAEWNAISKGSWWNSNCPFTEVVCSDGTVQV